MVYFVGAGSGAPDLITLRGDRLLRQADVVIYAGSLVNPELLAVVRPDCEIHNSANMTLEEIVAVIQAAEQQKRCTVRLHTGDPSLYGAIGEQIAALDERGVGWEIVPGVSSFLGAAAALGAEYTCPGASQTVILTRMQGRTPVPDAERISALAAHGASMAVFLSAGMLPALQQELLAGGYAKDTPAALVYKATWPDEAVFRCKVETLASAGEANGITKTALVLVGDFLERAGGRSKLYDPAFSTGYRRAEESE
jgi:precorrin-4 C11-methyltransferase